MIDRAAYLERIGHRGPTAPTPDVLRALVLGHVTAIPFENIASLLDQPLALDLASIQDKLVRRRRGGYCYEHNLLFLEILTDLGFRAMPLAARVLLHQTPEDPVPSRSHMMLEVELAGGPHLVDVGFGGRTLTGAVRLEPDVVQETPHGPVRLSRLEEGDLVLEASAPDGWRPLYRFDRTRAYLEDFEVASWYLCHHPESSFRHELMVARATARGRDTLSDMVLKHHPGTSEPTERELASASELRATLDGTFGIELTAGECQAIFLRCGPPGALP